MILVPAETEEFDGHPVEVDEKLVKVQDVKDAAGPNRGEQQSSDSRKSSSRTVEESSHDQASEDIGSGSQSGKAKSAAQNTAQGGRTQFNEGYSQEKSGFDSQFESGDAQYKEETLEGEDSTTTKISASGGHKVRAPCRLGALDAAG